MNVGGVVAKDEIDSAAFVAPGPQLVTLRWIVC